MVFKRHQVKTMNLTKIELLFI